MTLDRLWPMLVHMDPKSTPTRRERHLENDDRRDTAARFIRALGRHVGEGDTDHLAYFRELDATVELARHVAVDGLRRQGYSWEAIGLGLGVSRQAAWERYGRKLGVGHVLAEGHDASTCPACQ